MQEKIKNMINFAIRARKYCLGETILHKIRQGNSVKLVLIAKDASLQTQKKYIDKLTFYKVKYAFFSSKKELGELLHKEAISSIGIEEVNLANNIIKLMKEEN